VVDPLREHFGKTLKAIREESRQTRKDAAKLLDIPERTLVEIEGGRAPVELRIVQKAARAYPGHLAELLQKVLPSDWSDDEVKRRLFDAFAETGLRQFLEGLSRHETLSFVMNVAQLPVEELRVVNQWVLARLNYLGGPGRVNLSEQLATTFAESYPEQGDRNAK